MSDRKYAVKLDDNNEFRTVYFEWYENNGINDRKFIPIKFEDEELAEDLVYVLNEFPNRRQALRLAQTIVDLQE